MIIDRQAKLLHRASEAMRQHGTETNRQCTVKEVKEEGGERKVRCILGVRPDGSEWLSPWMSTQEQRSGQERSQSAIKPGQNGVIQGSFRQGTFSPQGEAKHAPQPKHAPETNGFSSSVGKKLRIAQHGGQDDQQQQGGAGGGGTGGAGGGGAGGGQQQQKGDKKHYSAQWLSKEPEKMEKWQPQSGKAKSTSTGGGGGAGSGGASSGSGNQQSAQQDQQGQQKQQKDERAMQVVMHEDGGAYAVIGKGDDGVRYAAHEKGAKVRAGKENYFVAEKDKDSIMRAKKDVYVTSEGDNVYVYAEKKHFVKEPWIIKGKKKKDPVPNHDLGEDSGGSGSA